MYITTHIILPSFEWRKYSKDHFPYYNPDAEILENSPIAVTIIEPEKDKAEMAAASLRSAVVLHGDATEIDVLKDAAVEITDIFIALSENEQSNLLTSLLAKKNDWLTEPPEKPQIALSAEEKEGEKPKLIVYTILDLKREKINDELKERGMGRLVKIAEVKKIKEIPVTATGKVQYRKLDVLV